MAMFTRTFKKFLKKTKAGMKQKQPSRSKNNDRDQFTSCFKCGKMDHIIKNYPQLKEEQAAESPSRLFRKKGGNNSGKKFEEQCWLLGVIPLMKKKGLEKKKKEPWL